MEMKKKICIRLYTNQMWPDVHSGDVTQKPSSAQMLTQLLLLLLFVFQLQTQLSIFGFKPHAKQSVSAHTHTHRLTRPAVAEQHIELFNI